MDYLPSTFKYSMDESSTTNNTEPDNPIENTGLQETVTTKDARNMNTLQELIDLSSDNTFNESMSNRGNNADNAPAGNNSDNDDSTEAQNYSDGPLNVLKKLLKIESVADAPICAAAAIQTLDLSK